MNQPLASLDAPLRALAHADAGPVYRYWFARRALDPEVALADPFADKYRMDHRLWFGDAPAVDDEIRQHFAHLMQRAAGGELDSWGAQPRDAVCLALLLGPLRRRAYRGTPAAHAAEEKALGLARSALDRGLARELAPAEALPLFLTLMLSERLEDARLAVDGLSELSRRCARPQQLTARAWRNSARKHLDLLERFGRDPQRNVALGRESTPAELAFLAHPEFSALFRPAPEAPRPPRPVLAPEPPAGPRLRVLVLHGLRQNGEFLRARTSKLRQALAGVAELTYLTAPHRLAGGEKPSEHAWWNPSTDNRIYHGFEESVAFVEAFVRTEGPFDGVIGFSQGGTLAAALVARQPHPTFAFRFAVCISAFPSRALGHEELAAPGNVKLPSLHVIGLADQLVDPERSRQLFEAFDPEQSALVTHLGSHFSPGGWPHQAIRDFLARFAPEASDAPAAAPSPAPSEAPEASPLLALCTEALAHEPIDLAGANSLVREMVDQERWNDLRAAALCNRERFTPADLACPDGSARVGFHEAVVDEFVRRLRADLDLAARLEARSVSEPGPRRRKLLAVLGPGALAAATEPGDRWPSRCALGAPRVGSHTDKVSRLAKDIAVELFPAEEMLAFLREPPAPRPAGEPLARESVASQGARRRGPRSLDEASRARRLAYQRYAHTLSILTGTLADMDPALAAARDRRLAEAKKPGPEALAEQRARPVTPAITEPEPMPVVPCALEDLAPLLDHLSADVPIERQTAFARGTLTTDGRLDLCKQVVGPEGIGPLLGAMKHTHHVRRLLLGNNIVGDGGAEAIAAFLRERHDSPLDCWYIAGNLIGPAGIGAICEALAHDERVTSLWLKRNPLKPAGMIPLAQLLRTNRRLEVLDLVNCGLLDEGLVTVLGALTGPGRNTTLRHLYVGTNGVTERSAGAIAAAIGEGCSLESLSLSCNRIGDEGVEIFAPALARNRSLRRLSLASNRLGPRGAAALCRALAENTTLEQIDLGFTKATLAVGELGNLLGDEGAREIARLLTKNRTLLSLDLLHNDISQLGVNLIREALATNTTLLSLQLTQFGRAHNEAGREEIRAALARNRALVPAADAGHLAQLELPDHIAEIYSVYRTHM